MKYDLVGIDGNAFAVMSYVLKAMIECGCNKVDQAIHVENVKSGDYDHLLAVSVGMIDRCNEICGSSDEE
jgi:hypothetical protein